MRVIGISVVFLLSLCLMTYGFTGVSFAQSDQPPLSVNTDQDIYSENAKITVSGEVKDSSLKKNATPVIIQIIGPTGNIVGIAQEMLDSNNAYSASFKAAGQFFKSAGEYVVVAKYDAQKATTTFDTTKAKVAKKWIEKTAHSEWYQWRNSNPLVKEVDIETRPIKASFKAF